MTGVGRRAGIGYAIARRLAAERLMVQHWAPHDAAQPWGADDGVEAALRADFPGVEIVACDFADPARAGAAGAESRSSASGTSTCWWPTTRIRATHRWAR